MRISHFKGAYSLGSCSEWIAYSASKEIRWLWLVSCFSFVFAVLLFPDSWRIWNTYRYVLFSTTTVRTDFFLQLCEYLPCVHFFEVLLQQVSLCWAEQYFTHYILHLLETHIICGDSLLLCLDNRKHQSAQNNCSTASGNHSCVFYNNNWNFTILSNPKELLLTPLPSTKVLSSELATDTHLEH
mgnify:CR=1 FL=1